MSPSFAVLIALASASTAGLIASHIKQRKLQLDFERHKQQTKDLNEELSHCITETHRLKDENKRLTDEQAYLLRLATVAEVGSDGACLCTPSGEIEWVNDAWTQITGYSLDESKGKRPGRMLHGPDTDAGTVRRLREAIQAKAAITEEITNYTKSGTKIWIRLHVRPVLSPKGKLAGFVGTQTDLTMRRVTQKRLERLHERAELALSAGGYGIWEWWPQPNRCEWDERTCGLYSKEKGANTYEEWMGCILLADRPSVETHLRSVLLGREPLKTSFRINLPDGKTRHVEIQGQLQRDEAGAPQRMTGLVRDITEELGLREQLRLAVERLRLSLRGANDGVWEWNVAENRFIMDERWQGLTGRPASEAPLTRADFEGYLHPEDLPLAKAALDAHLAKKTPFFEAECRVGRPNGEWVWVRWRGSILSRDTEKRPLQLCGTYTDVTEHHRTEAALRRSALLLRQMCQQMGIAAWEIEAESFALHWTEELDLLHSAPPDFDPSLEHLLALYPSDSRRELSKMLEAAIENQAPFDVEVRWKRAHSDSNAWFRWIGQPVVEDGRIQAVCGLIQDVSGLREDSAQRRELDSRLAELHEYEALSAITDDLAYDLNSMLGGLIGYQELALEEMAEGSKARQYVAEALRSSNRTNDIIRQVLLLNRVKPISRIGLRLPLLVDELCEHVMDMLPSTITLVRNIDRRCPPVLGDASQLQQAFLHIAHHTAGILLGKPGKMEISLRSTPVSLNEAAPLGLTLSGTFACLEIRVELATLTDEEWSQLFEHPSNDPGLHLTAARKILAEHHGVLWTQFHPVHGGLCQAWIPLAETVHSIPPSAAPMPMGGGERVWIIDQERFIAHLAKLSLERTGYAVECFRSEQECLDALKERPTQCSVLLLGSSLLPENAVELLSAARQLRPGLPAIALGNSRQESRLRGFVLLEEPFTAADLGRTLHDALHPLDILRNPQS